jgi:hypothetical protein
MTEDHDPEWNLGKVKPVTRGLIEAIVFKDLPTPAALNDFGIESPRHYEAISRPLLNDEITFAQLDAAYGNGPKLTELVNAAASNPHKGIVFETPWDHILPRDGPKVVPRNMDELKDVAAKQDRGPGQTNDRTRGR